MEFPMFFRSPGSVCIVPGLGLSCSELILRCAQAYSTFFLDNLSMLSIVSTSEVELTKSRKKVQGVLKEKFYDSHHFYTFPRYCQFCHSSHFQSNSLKKELCLLKHMLFSILSYVDRRSFKRPATNF